MSRIDKSENQIIKTKNMDRLTGMLVFLLIFCGCSNTQERPNDPKLGEYLYLELNKGAICHLDNDCAKSSTYIKTDYVLSEIKRCSKHVVSGNAKMDVVRGNYHFCAKCVPLKVMKQIDSLTRSSSEQ